MRDAARLDHVPEQTEIRQIESHEATFAKYEARIIIMAIAYGYRNDNLSYDAKSGLRLIFRWSFVSIAGRSRIS
jgi:hypothetical protein